MLRYLRQPMIDVGVATITAYSQQKNPSDVSEQALDAFIEEVLRLYMNPAMAGYLSYVVFANARFANPAQIKNPKYDESRRAALKELLTLWKPGAVTPTKEEPADPDETCVFSGDPAIIRASRMLIPMTTDESNINFVPMGRPRLPIAGWCLLALLAMPLGALNSNGKLWIVHSLDPTALLHFARQNLERNLAMFQMQGLEKLTNYKFARTHLLKDLVSAQADVPRQVSLTAYLFTSSGQKSEINIFHLPTGTVRFVALASRLHPDAWEQVVKRAWAMQGVVEEKEPGIQVYQEKNYFYEDLFDLPQNAVVFLRRYLLRQPATGKTKNDPRTSYSPLKEREAISWPLIELFLEKVMNMDKDRINHIRDVADRLAEYIRHHDSRLFDRLFNARNDYQIRLELLKAAKSSKENLLPYDQFIQVFFVDETGDTAKPDWYLARDLLMIRIIERLHQGDWLEKNPDVVAAAEGVEDASVSQS